MYAKMLMLMETRLITVSEQRETTELFNAGVPEKVIQERTGHLSLTGLHQYERTNYDQQLAVSRVLLSSENTTYCQQLIPTQSCFLPTSAPTGCTVSITNHPSQQYVQTCSVTHIELNFVTCFPCFFV